ncbi:hypothetical protein [Leekyejoonella antrihumi]|uniref:hypothetical protein n=1 Tax=Leekyejoonella antrihumi TaxID=1660198 RepID=UPI0011B56D20|nr:hypothetical protein [Leekyejoonella antrihumi]
MILAHLAAWTTLPPEGRTHHQPPQLCRRHGIRILVQPHEVGKVMPHSDPGLGTGQFDRSAMRNPTLVTSANIRATCR